MSSAGIGKDFKGWYVVQAISDFALSNVFVYKHFGIILIKYRSNYERAIYYQSDYEEDI